MTSGTRSVHTPHLGCGTPDPLEFADVEASPRPGVRELLRLAQQLDARSRTFPFDHARLAWLESQGGTGR